MRVVAGCVLVSLFLIFLAFTIYPTFVLEIRTKDGERVWCSIVERGTDIAYLSVNSIYKVPVQELLRIEDDAALRTIRVISTPDVIYYYGIESFTPLANGMVSAVPNPVRYREVRFKIGTSGQQSLVASGQRVALYELAAEGEAVTAQVREVARALACR